MNHQPTQLALLISLIGIGAAPHANATASISARLDAGALDGLAVDASQPLPGAGCDELASAVLPGCGANIELTWLPARNSLDRTATAGVRVLYTSAARDDWAPGEVAGEVAAASARFGHWVPRESVGQTAKAANQAREPVRQSSRKSSAKAAGKQAEKHADKTTRKVRVLAQVPTSTRVKMPVLAQGDAAILRIELLKPAAQVAEAGSKQVDRLLDSLAAVFYDTPAAPVADRPPSMAIDSAAPATSSAEPVDIVPAPVVAAAPSAKVLRQLGAILAEERDEVGATRREDPKAVVTTQTGKVMGMLAEIVAAQPPVEDGPARRLRKLAARAAKAEANAAADTAASLAA